MTAQVYSLFEDGKVMVPMTPEGKNDLPIGTRLRLNGYDNPEFVIVKNQGISKRFPGYGAKYLSVNLETRKLTYHEAFSLKWLHEKKNDRIQTYILPDLRMPPDEVKALYAEALEADQKEKEEREATAKKADEDREKGKALIDSIKPKWAKAVIVAYQEFDDCDMMTDYFATKSGPAYLLAWSKHTRDLFPEMRKAAANMEETKHLAKRPVFTGPESERKWWSPEDEHREKYSMGAGYYLKASNRYSTGWKVEKWPLTWKNDAIYQAAGEGRCLIKAKARKPQTPSNNGRSDVLNLILSE